VKQLHKIQLKILDGLLFASQAKYSDLKPVLMENSQFVFHLEQLIKLGLVKKDKTKYTLTPEGKEYANRIFIETMRVESQAKVTTVICAVKEEDEKKQLLLYERLKNPFYGCIGFPTEKPWWGEKIADAARRGLQEEAGMDGQAELFAIRHYRVYSRKKKLVEDKLMHAFLFKNPKGKLESNIEGDFFWTAEKDLKKKVTKPLEEFWEFYEALKNFKGRITFKEIDVKTKKF
jgi:ADP-ribose pyrophosphatase YjhB (NUDIX family)